QPRDQQPQRPAGPAPGAQQPGQRAHRGSAGIGDGNQRRSLTGEPQQRRGEPGEGERRPGPGGQPACTPGPVPVVTAVLAVAVLVLTLVLVGLAPGRATGLLAGGPVGLRPLPARRGVLGAGVVL